MPYNLAISAYDFYFVSIIFRIFTFSLMERTSRLLLGLETLPALLLRFGVIIMASKDFLNTNTCDKAAINANSENARSSMEASSAGKCG